MRETRMIINLMIRAILGILYVYGIVFTACLIFFGWPITVLLLICIEDFFKVMRRTFPIGLEIDEDRKI